MKRHAETMVVDGGCTDISDHYHWGVEPMNGDELIG